MILVLSGTADGREIAECLIDNGYPVLVSTATHYGKTLQQEGVGQAAVRCGILTCEGMEKLIREKAITSLVDATHPYAVNVSKTAIEAARRCGIQYIRYERRETSLSPATGGILRAGSYEEAARISLQQAAGGNIFLTVGSRHLAEFCRLIPVSRIIARVLPQSDIIRHCEELGLEPRNIIGMQGPFGTVLNRELYRKYGAKVVVSKDGGRTGGTPEKIEAARQAQIPIILVNRPRLDYTLVAGDKDQLLRYLQEQTTAQQQHAMKMNSPQKH